MINIFTIEVYLEVPRTAYDLTFTLIDVNHVFLLSEISTISITMATNYRLLAVQVSVTAIPHLNQFEVVQTEFVRKLVQFCTIIAVIVTE